MAEEHFFSYRLPAERDAAINRIRSKVNMRKPNISHTISITLRRYPYVNASGLKLLWRLAWLVVYEIMQKFKRI